MGPRAGLDVLGEEKNLLTLTGFQNQDNPACSAVAIVTVLSWLWNEGDEDKAGTEERRKE